MSEAGQAIIAKLQAKLAAQDAEILALKERLKRHTKPFPADAGLMQTVKDNNAATVRNFPHPAPAKKG